MANKPLPMPWQGNYTRGHWIALAIAALIWILGFAILIATFGCTHYNPALFPSYDVLNPGPEVRANPLSISLDEKGNPVFVVNAAFLQWVDELKAEIIKLRKGK